MLLLWLGTLALLTSPDLHNLLHKDSCEPDHLCLITKLLQHSPALATITIAAPLPATLPGYLPVRLFEFVPICDLRLYHSRAPPQACLFFA